MVRQFLPDALEVRLRVRIIHLLAAGEGDPAYHRRLLRQILPLDTEVEGRQICLIVAGNRVASQTVAVILRLYDIAIVGRPAAHLSAMAPTILGHAGQIFQYTGSQLVHDLL